MNLDFAGRFNKEELLIKEFKYWVLIIREDVVTLGSCIIILKSGKPNLKDVTQEEMSEFSEVCKYFEEKTKQLFGAEKWNYCAMMMKDEFVHFHAIPRYAKEINMYDRTWIDTEWPKPTAMPKIKIDKEILMKIKEDMIN